MSAGEAAGMMSGLFFVGKGELLRWLNDFFKINYTKVEEVASGAIHCQILDSIFPGRVALHKVNFNARYDYEFVANYKVLQDVFAKEGLKKQVDVSKLVQAKFQDNLEFLQWMKHLWDTRYTGEEYDAVARREEAMAIYAKEHKFSSTKVAKPTTTAQPAAKKVVAPARPAVSSVPAAKPVSAKPAAPSRPAAAAPTHKPAAPAPAHKPAASHADEAAAAHNAEEIAELNGTISKLKVTIEGLEKERNFYFGKLREIEILCQTDETKDNETKQKVLEILYATDGAEDFEAPQAQEEPQEAQEAQEVPQDDLQQNYEENDGVIDNDGNY